MRSSPLLTIGIPTYNRPNYLRESLASALGQSYPNVEVVVSDNGDTDAAEKVVNELGQGRVRYHRNVKNIGASANFLKLLELASGDYFAWLQDDDLLFHEFATRAVSALENNSAASCYISCTAHAPTTNVLYQASILAPPFAMDWAGGRVSVIDGDTILPLSLFASVGIPPTQVIRTNVLRSHQQYMNGQSTYLFNERLLLSATALGSHVLVDPWIGGIFRTHVEQSWVREVSKKGEYSNQWLRMASVLNELAGQDVQTIADKFAVLLPEIGDSLLAQWLWIVNDWSEQIPLLSAVRDRVRTISTSRNISPQNPGLKNRVPGWALRLIPPVVVDMAKAVLRR